MISSVVGTPHRKETDVPKVGDAEKILPANHSGASRAA
jgi:hypothetical protein